MTVALRVALEFIVCTTAFNIHSAAQYNQDSKVLYCRHKTICCQIKILLLATVSSILLIYFQKQTSNRPQSKQWINWQIIWNCVTWLNQVIQLSLSIISLVMQKPGYIIKIKILKIKYYVAYYVGSYVVNCPITSLKSLFINY